MTANDRLGGGHRYRFGAVLALAALIALGGCHRNTAANIIDGGTGVVDNNGPDPADANMAPVGEAQMTVYAPPLGNARRQSAPAYATQPENRPASNGQAEPIYDLPNGQSQAGGVYTGAQTAPPPPDYNDGSYDAGVNSGLDAVEEADQPPPPLPVYEQPEAPAPNYLWTPGYWGYAPAGYFWVPGAWCAAPYPGALWTPGYWGYYGDRYRFHRGFWGLHIGFYGGIPYGFGYTGSGYHGGYWNGNNFFYNRSVNHINVTRITNVYNRTVVVNNITNNRISYNGGRGGIEARPDPAELVAMREPRSGPMTAQIQNRREAEGNRAQFFADNHGRPAVVAAQRPFVADRGIAAPPRPSPAAFAGRPAENIRPGVGTPANGNPRANGDGRLNPGTRPGNPADHNVNAAAQRPGQPNQQFGQRPGQPNPDHPTPGQPFNAHNDLRNAAQPRPGDAGSNRPGQPQNAPDHTFNRPNPQPNQAERPADSAFRQNEDRNFNRPNQPAQQQQPAAPRNDFRPNPQPQPRQETPAARPDFGNRPENRPQPQQQQQPRPQPQQPRQDFNNRPMPQSRPRPQAPRPEPRPAPQQRAPEEHGGGEHRR